MTKQEALIGAELMEQASDEFGNHGCNDFHLDELLPNVEDRRAIMKAYHEDNGDPEEFDPTDDYCVVADFCLMSLIAARLKEEATK